MKNTNTNTTEIVINFIEKETEKAVLVNVPVSWNMNYHVRSFWFPKSVIELYNDRTAYVADWFIEKLEKQNMFNNYEMRFDSFTKE